MASVKKRKVDQVGRPCRNGMTWPEMAYAGKGLLWDLGNSCNDWNVCFPKSQLIFDKNKIMENFNSMDPNLRWLFLHSFGGGANLSCFECRQNSKVIPTVDLTNLGSANFLMCWISNSWDGIRNTSRTRQVRWKWHCQPCRIKIIERTWDYDKSF